MPDPVSDALTLQFRTLYRLYYKRGEREAFFRDGKTPVSGLNEAGLAPLRRLELARLRRVVDLHAGDIGHQWYSPRVPASWLALQAVLDVPEAEVVHLLTECEAFESRINDDSDCRALADFVATLAEDSDSISPWLLHLLRYERWLGCAWPEGPTTRVEQFEYDVGGIRESLLIDRVCPTGERKRATWLLLHRATGEVRELALRRGEVEVLAALIEGRRPRGPARVIERCRALLREVRQDK